MTRPFTHVPLNKKSGLEDGDTVTAVKVAETPPVLVKVSVRLPLEPATMVPKSTEAGDTVKVGLIPVTLRGSVGAVPVKLVASVRVAERRPETAGVVLTTNQHEAPAASVVPQEPRDLTANSLDCAPEMVSAPRPTAAEPVALVLVSVMVLSNVAPTGKTLKSAGVGENRRPVVAGGGATPRQLSAPVMGVSALLGTFRVAVRVPATVGAHWVVIWQDAPTAKDVPQVLPVTE